MAHMRCRLGRSRAAVVAFLGAVVLVLVVQNPSVDATSVLRRRLSVPASLAAGQVKGVGDVLQPLGAEDAAAQEQGAAIVKAAAAALVADAEESTSESAGTENTTPLQPFYELDHAPFEQRVPVPVTKATLEYFKSLPKWAPDSVELGNLNEPLSEDSGEAADPTPPPAPAPPAPSTGEGESSVGEYGGVAPEIDNRCCHISCCSGVVQTQDRHPCCSQQTVAPEIDEPSRKVEIVEAEETDGFEADVVESSGAEGAAPMRFRSLRLQRAADMDLGEESGEGTTAGEASQVSQKTGESSESAEASAAAKIDEPGTPIHFPGDGGEPLTCHTNAMLKVYLDFMGTDHDDYLGVRLVATPYSVMGKERRLDTGEVLPDGFHHFMLHGEVDNESRGRKCFDPDLVYESDIEQIGPDSQEVAWGCTPFRVLGMQMQKAVKCAQTELGVSIWQAIEERFLHELSLEAQRQTTTDYRDAMIKKMEQVANSTFGAAAKFILTESRKAVLSNCFLDQQEPLICLPALSGSSGMISHGVWDQSADWIANVHHVVKRCNVPDGCSRLASGLLLHFNLRAYEPREDVYKPIAQPSWNDQCRLSGREAENWFESGLGTANNRLHSACMIRALKELCSTYAECCPSTAIHAECRANVTSSRCNDICTTPASIELGTVRKANFNLTVERVVRQAESTESTIANKANSEVSESAESAEETTEATEESTEASESAESAEESSEATSKAEESTETSETTQQSTKSS